MSLARFRLDADATGKGSLIVNDVDISKMVTAITFQSRPGNVPVMTLQVVSQGIIEGEGIVRIVDDSVAVPVLLREFLDSVDPMRLEELCLERTSFGDSPTMMMLDVLREMANAYKC